jgi:hypothetical protein
MPARILTVAGLFCGTVLLLTGVPPLTGQEKKGVRPGEVNTPPAKGERPSESLRVGDPAPDFTLPDLQGKNEITLSSFRDKKPVVLIFGSYT